MAKLTKEEMIKATEEIKAMLTTGQIYAAVARIIGEPLDPLRPYPKVVEALCEPQTVDAGEDAYTFDALLTDKKVFYIDASGAVQSIQVTPATPVQATFVDNMSQEFYVAFTDLLKAKYDVMANKNVQINRSLNAEEIKKVILVHDAAIINDATHRQLLESGQTKFRYPDLLEMRDAVKDYGDNYVLLVGSQVESDIALWDYDENKYHSLKDALDSLNIQIIRVSGTVFRHATADRTVGQLVEVPLLNTNKAILVALNTEMGKPGVFMRRKLTPIQILGGNIDGQINRAIIQTPAIMPVGATRLPAIGVVGFESIAVAVRNIYGLAGFYRGSSWVSEVAN
jgi:hypothetical protein